MEKICYDGRQGKYWKRPRGDFAAGTFCGYFFDIFHQRETKMGKNRLTKRILALSLAAAMVLPVWARAAYQDTADHWAEPAIEKWSGDYHILNGYEDGTFRPESTIKRAEVAAITNRMLARSADEAYVDAHASQLRLFADVAKDHWAYYTIVEASNTHDYQTNHGNETWKDA